MNLRHWVLSGSRKWGLFVWAELCLLPIHRWKSQILVSQNVYLKIWSLKWWLNSNKVIRVGSNPIWLVVLLREVIRTQTRENREKTIQWPREKMTIYNRGGERPWPQSSSLQTWEKTSFHCLSFLVGGPLFCQLWANKYISRAAGCRMAWRTKEQKWAWRRGEIWGWGLCFLAKGKRYSLTQMQLLISDPFGPIKMAIPYSSNQHEQSAWGKSVAACHTGEW